MNEEQYHRLCDACDNVMLEHDSSISRVAIPWLHVIREHPQFLVQYEELFQSVWKARSFLNHWKRTLRNRAGWSWQLARSMFEGGQAGFVSEGAPDKIDFLFVSHLVNTSQIGQEADFYFGDIPSELAARGYTVVIALLNHTNSRNAHLSKGWSGSKVRRVIFSKSVGVFEELAIHRRLESESTLLRKLAEKQQTDLIGKVYRQASLEALSGGSQTALRISEQVYSLVAKHHPKVVVVTYEGHAWERLAFAAARRAFPAVKCVAYQHAALFRMQHAIRRSLMNEYNPDHILTAGTNSKAQFESAPGLKGIQISVLGSNRSFKGAANIARQEQTQKQAVQSEKPACLVLPEGVLSECHILFEFSVECARADPDILFVWRLHPLVSFASLLAQSPKLGNLPGNIVLSHSTMEEDIARSRWVLYRGTTAVVQAVVAGLRPIYLRLPDELSIDPLYELEGWRINITNIAEFQRVIVEDSETTDCPQQSDISRAKRYCESLFTPFNVDAMTALIPEALE